MQVSATSVFQNADKLHNEYTTCSYNKEGEDKAMHQ